MYNKAALVPAACIPTVPIFLSKYRFLTQIDLRAMGIRYLIPIHIMALNRKSENVPLQIVRRRMPPRTALTRQCRSNRKKISVRAQSSQAPDKDIKNLQPAFFLKYDHRS